MSKSLIVLHIPYHMAEIGDVPDDRAVIVRHLHQHIVIIEIEMGRVFLFPDPALNGFIDPLEQPIPGLPSKQPVKYAKTFDFEAD